MNWNEAEKTWRVSDTSNYNENMTNADVLQSMTVRELANLLNDINSPRWGFFDERDWEDWLRSDSHSQADCGLLTDEQKKYWKVH